MIGWAYYSPVTVTDTGPFSLFCQSTWLEYIDYCRDVKRISTNIKNASKDIAYPSFKMTIKSIRILYFRQNKSDSLCAHTSFPRLYFNWLMFRLLCFIIQGGCVSLTSVLSVFEVISWRGSACSAHPAGVGGLLVQSAVIESAAHHLCSSRTLIFSFFDDQWSWSWLFGSFWVG